VIDLLQKVLEQCLLKMMELFYGFAQQNVKKNALVLKRDPRKLKWTKKHVKGGIRKN
jgi:hypothetical protein